MTKMLNYLHGFFGKEKGNIPTTNLEINGRTKIRTDIRKIKRCLPLVANILLAVSLNSACVFNPPNFDNKKEAGIVISSNDETGNRSRGDSEETNEDRAVDDGGLHDRIESRDDGIRDAGGPEHERDGGVLNDSGLSDGEAGDAEDGGTVQDARVSNGWWNNGWGYCREITISGNHPVDYQHRVVLDRFSFDYSHSGLELRDFRFLPGFCLNQTSTSAALDHWLEFTNPNGPSALWFKTRIPNTNKVAMYYGNPSARNISDPDSVFIAFGRSGSWNRFVQVNSRRAYTIDSGGIHFQDFPWGNGLGESYIVKPVQLAGDFVFDYRISFETQNEGCRPYAMAAVSSTISNDFERCTDCVGVFRKSCTTSGKIVALRIRDNGRLRVVDSTFSVTNGAVYYVRLKKTGRAVTVSFHLTDDSRAAGTGALFSLTGTTSATDFSYLYPLVGLDVSDSTRRTTGRIYSILVRKSIQPEPVNFVAQEMMRP